MVDTVVTTTGRERKQEKTILNFNTDTYESGHTTQVCTHITQVTLTKLIYKRIVLYIFLSLWLCPSR